MKVKLRRTSPHFLCLFRPLFTINSPGIEVGIGKFLSFLPVFVNVNKFGFDVILPCFFRTVDILFQEIFKIMMKLMAEWICVVWSNGNNDFYGIFYFFYAGTFFYARRLCSRKFI